MKQELSTYYYTAKPNFGDALNPLLLERVFGQRITKANQSHAKLCGIGSLLEHFITRKIIRRIQKMFLPDLHVWSTGTLYPALPVGEWRRKFKIHALRGNLTKQIMETRMGCSINVPLGDGALLSSLIFDQPKAKKYSVGIIPHISETKLDSFHALQNQTPFSVLINFRENPLQVLEQISQCECIVSSALHGLIVADSLNIPNMWIEESQLHPGGMHKFLDYYSVYDSPPLSPKKIQAILAEDKLTDIIFQQAISRENEIVKIQTGLRDSFPLI